MRLKPRVEALEKRDVPWKPWHQILVNAGENQEEEIARYEAEHGPMGDDPWFIVRIIETPKQRDGQCA